MSQNVWCDGRMLAADELRISPFDRGLTVGLGLFETLLAWEGEPVFSRRHLARHAAGCERLGWPKLDEEEVVAAIRELLVANGLSVGEARVRLFQTAGKGDLADLAQGPDRRVVITATPLPPRPERISLMVSPWARNEKSPLVGLKTASYAENLLALSAARLAGFDEPLFLNTSGEICETATANLFVIKDSRLWTPPRATGCLPGITRGWLLENAPRLGFEREPGAWNLKDLEKADGLVLTSATRGVIPVSRLGESHWPQAEACARPLAEAWLDAVRHSPWRA